MCVCVAQELWGAAEKARRDQWVADKTKEIKEATVRGLEPDIQRLVARHRDETRKLEESIREEHRREARPRAARARAPCRFGALPCAYPEGRPLPLRSPALRLS